MARKRKQDESPKVAEKVKVKKEQQKKKKGKKVKEEYDDSDNEPPPAKTSKKSAKKESASHADDEHHVDDLDPAQLPPAADMLKILERIEAVLPKDDHVKFDSRAKKLDWEKVSFPGYGSQDCQRVWNFIQERIRRFRIMAEMLPDAREWIKQPWTNFYKSKDHNRHPEMPKKPLSMYMLFYSEKREQILKENPNLSMPEVAKICSEQYQKLSEKKKNKYKERCDKMRKEYDEKLQGFYTEHPEMRPIKPDKGMRRTSNFPAVTGQQIMATAAAAAGIPTSMPMMAPPQAATPQPIVNNAAAAAAAASQQQAVATITVQNYQNSLGAQPTTFSITPSGHMSAGPGGTIIIDPAYLQQAAQVQQQQQQVKQEQPLVYQTIQAPADNGMVPKQTPAPSSTVQQPLPQQLQIFPGAPEKPAKPFDHFFKTQMDHHMNEPNFDRQSFAEKCRKEWKEMKLKKKAKWIKQAADAYRDYDEKVTEFMTHNPGYVRPQVKNFLTQEDQKILDKFMGRPEKPPSSAYSLFSKEMLNNDEIKQFASKERMAQISERWKILPQNQKEQYQEEVNMTMATYRQQYEAWFNNLCDEDRRAETARNTSHKHKVKPAAPGQPVVQQQQQQQQQPVQIPQQPAMHSTRPLPVVTAQVTPLQTPLQPPVLKPVRSKEDLKEDILKREPIEPARSPKQLFVSEFLQKHKKKKPSDAKAAWKALDKKERKKWIEKLEPQRQQYIEAYTLFVRALDREELELYTQLKQRRDEEEEAKRANESSDSESESKIIKAEITEQILEMSKAS